LRRKKKKKRGFALFIGERKEGGGKYRVSIFDQFLEKD